MKQRKGATNCFGKGGERGRGGKVDLRKRCNICVFSLGYEDKGCWEWRLLNEGTKSVSKNEEIITSFELLTPSGQMLEQTKKNKKNKNKEAYLGSHKPE